MNIDGSQPYADANRSGYVTKNLSINMPSDCEIAIREVMIIDSTHVMVRLTGFTSSAHLKIWIAFYNSGTWYGWE